MEVKVGLLVLVGAGLLAVLVLVMGGVQLGQRFAITVDFNDTGGLQSGAPVKIAGVRVGTIDRMEFRGTQPDTRTGRAALVRVHARIDERYRRELHRDAAFFVTTLLRLLTVITAIVLFVGYAGIKELIESAAGKAVASELEHRAAEFEVSGTLAGLQSALVAAESTGSFTNTAREGMINAIEVLSQARKKGVRVSQNPAFLPTLEQVVTTMAVSNNDIYADKIYDLFPDDCLAVAGIVEAYLQHYGRQAVGGVGEVRSEAIKRFGKFERAASTFKFPETALAHRALIDFQAQGEKPEKASRDAIARIAGLTGSDRARAMNFWDEYSKESWLKKSTGESKGLQSLVVAFFKAHKDDLRPTFPDIDERIRPG